MAQLVRLGYQALCGWLPGGRRHCVFCQANVWRFMPYRGGSAADPPLMAALEVVGSDVDHFKCPRCFSHDRERHLHLYFAAAGLYAQMDNAAILHFAPEKHLSKSFQASNPARYVRCDLHPADEEVERVDMCAMPFENASFDLVVANHVLEHVADDRQALAEVRRVLRDRGLAVLQTPFSRTLLSTWEDPGICEPRARQEAYGQGDHVRLYGRDFFDRVAAAGFRTRCADHTELLGNIDAARLGVNPLEPLMLFERA